MHSTIPRPNHRVAVTTKCKTRKAATEYPVAAKLETHQSAVATSCAVTNRVFSQRLSNRNLSNRDLTVFYIIEISAVKNQTI